MTPDVCAQINRFIALPSRFEERSHIYNEDAYTIHF